MACINYAHRGASTYAPENTLAAFYMAIEMGADGIETDIQRTRDGVLVLHHDDKLARVAGAKGGIRDYTYRQLLEMDMGSFLGEKYVGEKIVTLEEFLIHFGAKPLEVALEIKHPGIEAEAIQMAHLYTQRHRIIFTSFCWESVMALRHADASIRLGYLTGAIDEAALAKLLPLHIQQICPRADLLDEAGMKLARLHGVQVRAWGVRSEELMHHALRMGVDGMTVNFPDKLTAALRRLQSVPAHQSCGVKKGNQ